MHTLRTLWQLYTYTGLHHETVIYVTVHLLRRLETIPKPSAE